MIDLPRRRKRKNSPPGDDIVQVCFRIDRTKRDGMNIYAALHDTSIEILLRKHIDELLGYEDLAAGVVGRERAESAASAGRGE